LNGTKYLKLSISVENLGILKWYVDRSHNMHWDCKGHGGAMFTMGEGAVSSYSRKVKLNTRSSTEMELVAADMYMPEMLWALYFMESQGYEVECIGLHQDNTSTQLLMTNGQFSSGKKTKHTRAKFFFIKDRIDDGEMIVVNCPTEGMWADILTKPLQGKAFRLMRLKLTNCEEDYFENEEPEKKHAKRKPVVRRVSRAGSTQPLQECVGRSAISRGLAATDRQPIVESRIVRRRTQRPIERRGE